MKLAVFFTVIAVSVLIDKANSMQNKNIQNILQSLQQQLQQEQHRKEQQNSNKLPRAQEHEYYPHGSETYGSLKYNLFDKASNLLSSEPKVHNKRKQQSDRAQYTQKNPNSKIFSLIDSLLGQDKKNSITSSFESDDRDQAAQNEFSKIYVVLNSEAIKRSKNKDKLNQLLSSLLAPQLENKQEGHVPDHHQNRERKFHVKADNYHTGDQNDRYQQQNNQNNLNYLLKAIGLQDERNNLVENNYSKGFLNQNYFRRRGPGDRRRGSAEGDYDKPLRERREKPRRERGRGGGRGGGGGGGGGSNSHTAIPYIRQHADIYERDN